MARTQVQTLVIVPEPETAPHEGAVRYAAVEDVTEVVQEKAEEIRVEVVAFPTPEPPLPIVQETPANALEAILSEPFLARNEETTADPVAPTLQEPPLPEHIPTPWKERLLRGDRDEEDLDRQMRDSAVAISYELLLEREGLLETPLPAPAPPVAPESVEEVEPPTVAAQPAAVASRSFTDWLSTETTDIPQSTAPIPKEPPPPQAHRAASARPVVDPEIIRAVHQLPPMAPRHAPETPETKALIDRFLQQNSQAPPAPKKAEFFNPQTAAKRSLEEHADLVTETLARIYEKQGNIAKAIAAYERLAVKHPEKSAHFRALAKALTGR